MNPCTKGIYVWGRPIVVEREEEGPMSILLVDTEGIGSIQQDQTYDVKIFSLAVLLSSYFVYNSMSIIDERALDGLSLVVNLTKQISVRSHANGAKANGKGKNAAKGEEAASSASELGAYFPSFLWLLRDFALDLVDEKGAPITSAQYLEHALRERPESAASQSKNAIRSAIKQLFRERDCVTLVRPVVDERQLKTIDSIPYNQLRPEFREQSEELVQKILDEAQPKQINGQNLSGDSFAQLLQLYVEAINSGAVASIQSAWESLSAQVNNNAQEEAMHAWTSGINARYNPNRPLGEEHLQALHLECMSEAFGIYDAMCYHGAQASAIRKQLKAKMVAEFAKLVTSNREASTRFVLRLLNGLYEPLEAKAKAHQYATFDALLDAWNALKKAYFDQLGDSQASRLVAYDEFVKFFSKNLATTAAYVSRAIQDEHATQIENWRKKLDALQSDKHALELAAVKATEENKHLHAQIAAADKNIKHLEAEASKASERLADAQRQLTKVTADLAKTASDLAKATAEVKIAQNNAQAAESKLNAEIAKLTAGLNEKTALAGDAKRDLESLKKKLSTAEAALANATQSSEKNEKLALDRAKATESATRAEQEKLTQTLQKATANVEKLEREREAKEAARAKLEKDVSELTKKATAANAAKETSESMARQLTQKVKERDAEVSELKKQLASASTVHLADAQRTQKSATETQAQLKKLQDTVNARTSEKEDERRAKEVALSQLDELHHRHVTEVGALNSDLELKNSELARLKREVEDLKKRNMSAPISRASVPFDDSAMLEDDVPEEFVEEPVKEKPARAKAMSKATSSAKKSSKAAAVVSEPIASSSTDIDIMEEEASSSSSKPSAKKTTVRGKKSAAAPVLAASSAMDIDDIPLPAAPSRKRGRPTDFSETAEATEEEVGTPSKSNKKAQNDPNKMDKATLKSILTAAGVKLPVGDHPKKHYLDLYNKKFNASAKK